MGIWRALLHLGCALPLLWLGSVLVSGDDTALGADPVKELIHFLGDAAILIFCSMFLLGMFLHWRQRYDYQILRRPLGLWAFFYALLHIGTFLWLELALDLNLFWQEVTQRPYLGLGAVAFLMLMMMSITSLPSLKQRLGKRWFKLHQWGYVALVSASVHYYWSVKSLTLTPIAVGLITLWIVVWRLMKRA